MSNIQNDSVLSEIESLAVDVVSGAGEILRGYFGSSITVEYKSENHGDPVTVADTDSQAYIEQRIFERFPDHEVLGEEDKKSKGFPAPDFVWIIDPLDGTKNFLNGFPVYACSAGVLYRGEPVVGAIYLPWPNEAGSMVIHSRKGEGSRFGQDDMTVLDAGVPLANRLTGLPASLGSSYKPTKNDKARVGEARVVGSIAYEMAMTAIGVFQHSIIAGGRIWDVAGGSSIILGAGGQVLVGIPKKKRLGVLGVNTKWQRLESFFPKFERGITTLEEMRSWAAPLVVGSPKVTEAVATSLSVKSGVTGRVRRALNL